MDTRDEIRAYRAHQAAKMLAKLQHTLPPVLAQYPIDAAYVYGSVARGTMLPSSDVDIALVLRDILPSYDRLMLELTIQGAIEEAMVDPDRSRIVFSSLYHRRV